MRMSKQLPRELEQVRRDLSGWLWHFCRRDDDPFATLRAILDSGHVRGGTDRYCLETAVCLTETPLVESARQSALLESRGYGRLSDYGIGFRKEWVFAKGGLPVIYQPAGHRVHLPEAMRWRHCDLDYNRGIDFMWQREWRVPGARLEFTADDDIMVVVRTESEAMERLCSGHCIDFERNEFYFDVDWSYVTHERLRDASRPHDVETLHVKPDR
jgi:hypothetical protein